MGKALSPLVKQELANLDKDPGRRRTAMNALKSYVELLDTGTIPLFLDEVSDSKESSKASRQYAISLYEVLAKVHGKNIIPHTSKIMTTVVKTLSSSAGSLPLQQACGRVVAGIARYGIDTFSTGAQQEGVIRDLCTPLLDVLIGKVEPLAAGAALCLQALVETDSWKFASVDIVNEVCLRVTGALEETLTQTVAHMSLVCSLAKLNCQILEAYGRSLIKAGVQILEDGVANGNWRRRVIAVEMINSLLKSVDTQIVSSEIPNLVDSLERCRLDREPSVRDAIAEALRTVEKIASEKRLTNIMSCKEERSPCMELSPYQKSQRRRSLWGERDFSCSSSRTPQFGSQESYVVSYTPSSVSSFSPVSLSVKSDAHNECRRVADCSVSDVRKQMQFEKGGVDISLKDGILSINVAESDAHRRNGESRKIWSHIHPDHGHEGSAKESQIISSDDFHGFTQFNTVNENEVAKKIRRPTILSDKGMFSSYNQAGKEDASQMKSSPGTSSFCDNTQYTPLEEAYTGQMSTSPLTIEDFNLFTSPRKIFRTLQQQSSPECSSVEGYAGKQCENNKFDASSEGDSSVADSLTSNHTNYKLRKRMQRRANVLLEGGALLDKFADTVDETSNANVQEANLLEGSSVWPNVQRTESMSTTFSNYACMDHNLEPQLPNVMSANALESNAEQSCVRDDRLKSKRPRFILRSIFAVLFLTALLMIVKHLKMQEENHLLVPT